MSHRTLLRCVLLAWALGGCRPAVDDASTAVQPSSALAPKVAADETPPATLAPVPECRPHFADTAADRGIDFTLFNDEAPERFFLPEVMGAGFAWLDYDGDGWRDLYLLQGAVLKDVVAAGGAPVAAGPAGGNRLYRNLQGRFQDVSCSAGQVAHPGYGQGAAVGDFNADGFPDLYLTNYGANALLLNLGDGTFEDVTESAGVGDRMWGSSTVWWDADGDHDLDLYVCNYLDVNFENSKVCRFSGAPGYCGPGEYAAQPDRVYLNQGDGSFVEASEALGLVATNGKGLAICAADFDNDGLPEIYVANDMAPNFLFTRSPESGGASADGLYRETAVAAGCATSDMGLNEASMGIACADFDNDGNVDIFLTHFYSAKNTLYRNLGGLIFRDDSKRSRIAANSFETLGFGTVAFDYDQDGDSDLFVANGHVLGPNNNPNEMKPQLLMNVGAGRFDDISGYAGAYFEQLYLGRGAGGCDFDNDGDTDVAVSHLHRPLALLENRTEVGERVFLGLELRTRWRMPATGARLTLQGKSETRVVSVTAAGSYLCSSDDRLLVGWAPGEAVRVRVAWPDGDEDDFGDLPPNQYWRLTQGQSSEALGAVLGWPPPRQEVR